MPKTVYFGLFWKNKLTWPKNGIHSLPMLYKKFSLVLFFLKKRTKLCSNLG